MQNGRMFAAAKLLADFRQTEIGHLTAEINRNMPRIGNRPVTALGRQFGNAKAEEFSCFLLNKIYVNAFAIRRDEVGQRILAQFKSRRFVEKTTVGQHPMQRAFQLADIGLDFFGDEPDDVVIQHNAVLFRFLPQYRLA